MPTFHYAECLSNRISNDIRWFITYETAVGIYVDKERLHEFFQYYKISHKSDATGKFSTEFIIDSIPLTN